MEFVALGSTDEIGFEAELAKARDRAELYGNAANLRIVRILSITEGGGYFGPPNASSLDHSTSGRVGPDPAVFA